ncbi:MAG: hypothetical protein Q9M92_11265 [Enterobacterales bacterium]|nr:hypothetical protein [Enterobacterales bacterium]
MKQTRLVKYHFLFLLLIISFFFSLNTMAYSGMAKIDDSHFLVVHDTKSPSDKIA